MKIDVIRSGFQSAPLLARCNYEPATVSVPAALLAVRAEPLVGAPVPTHAPAGAAPPAEDAAHRHAGRRTRAPVAGRGRRRPDRTQSLVPLRFVCAAGSG